MDGNELRRQAAAHVFVDDLDALTLDEDDHHHLSRSLRLRAGELVTASNGRGDWRPTRWTGRALESTEAVRSEPASSPALTVGFVATKGDRPERVVRALTELGIDTIELLSSRHGVVRWDADRAARHRLRLERIAREAAMQSRRVWLPVVAGMTPLTEVVARAGVGLADPDGRPLTIATSTVLVGPEGGWHADERPLAPMVSLGSSILRAETAALAAGVRMSQLRDETGGLHTLRG